MARNTTLYPAPAACGYVQRQGAAYGWHEDTQCQTGWVDAPTAIYRRGILAFDVTVVPTDVVIEAATLYVPTCTYTGSAISWSHEKHYGLALDLVTPGTMWDAGDGYWPKIPTAAPEPETELAANLTGFLADLIEGDYIVFRFEDVSYGAAERMWLPSTVGVRLELEYTTADTPRYVELASALARTRQLASALGATVTKQSGLATSVQLASVLGSATTLQAGLEDERTLTSDLPEEG